MLLSSRSVLSHKPHGTIIPFLAAIVALFLLASSIYHRDDIASSWSTSNGVSDWLFSWQDTRSSASQLSRDLLILLNEHSPASTESLEAAEKAKADRWSPDAEDEIDLMSTLNVTSRQTLALKKAHAGFVQAIRNNRGLPASLASPPETATATQGIVTVAGGSYFPPLLVSLRLLRRTGTTLPVEVFLPKADLEHDLCTHVLPSLGATCRTFSRLDGRISRYQLKVFAVLLSSFADVLWLDADNFPLSDAAPLFRSAPFRSVGLITWPDLWRTSVSPAYYDIAGREPTPVSARASTEAGQLLVSKRRHWATLLLAAYYNYYGPEYYYPLLCQARAGAGDKETFLPAAETVGLPFYDVKAPARGLGHFRNKTDRGDGLYRFALVQADPVSDYEVTRRLGLEEAAVESDAGRKTGAAVAVADEGADSSDYDGVPPLFLHMMTPKCKCCAWTYDTF